MNHLDLFSGIGGFALASYWVWGDEHNVVAFCEQDKFCRDVLKMHWPDVPVVEDVRDVKRIQRCCSANVDLLTGGFPCQGFSVAGKRRGKEDDRYLWPEMLEVIKAVRPRWIIGENVTGIVNLALDTVLSDLEAESYTCQAFIIPACAQNAPHRRDRVWIVAHSPCLGRRRWNNGNETRESRALQAERSRTVNKQSYVAYSKNTNDKDNRGRQRQIQYRKDGGTVKNRRQSQPRLGVPDDGFPRWLVGAWGTGEWEERIPRVATGIKNRVNKLRALGNAICIPTVMPIMQAIKEVD